jgi:hypothetical protein
VRLLRARRAGNLDFEVVCVDLVGGAADPLQEELQVEEQPWVGDEDVQSRSCAPSSRSGELTHSDRRTAARITRPGDCWLESCQDLPSLAPTWSPAYTGG